MASALVAGKTRNVIKIWECEIFPKLLRAKWKRGFLQIISLSFSLLSFFLIINSSCKAKIDINLSKISFTSVNADAWGVGGMCKHLLLTEFEVHTVRCGPSFFPLIYGPSRSARVIVNGHKNEDL